MHPLLSSYMGHYTLLLNKNRQDRLYFTGQHIGGVIGGAITLVFVVFVNYIMYFKLSIRIGRIYLGDLGYLKDPRNFEGMTKISIFDKNPPESFYRKSLKFV